MKIAYLILAHRYPEQLERLVSRLPSDAPVFVHFDGRAVPEVFAEAQRLLTERSNVRFVKRHRCYWGSVGIVHATLECIRGLVESGLSFDYAMLLSGQDYPIKTADRIQRFLAEHRGREFIECFKLEEPNRWTPQGGAIQAMNRVQHLHLRFRSRVLSIPARRRFPQGLVPWGGSQWWCLSADCIRFIHRFSLHDRRDVLQFFEYVAIPDESYFQTVVAASPYAQNTTSDDLKYAVWDRPEPPHPATLGAQDLEQLAATTKLFARKFDASNDPHVLDLIDRTILGTGSEEAVLVRKQA